MIFRGRMLNGVAVPDVPSAAPDGTPVEIEITGQSSNYWSNLDLEVHSIQQDVKPVRSLEDLAGDWPENDSIEMLVALLREARS